MINLSPTAFAIRKILLDRGEPVLSNSHTLELIAAALSYRTLAALQAEKKAMSSLVLSDAKHIILRESQLVQRIGELQLEIKDHKMLFDTLVKAMQANWSSNTIIHRSFEDFEDYLQQDVQERAWDDDGVVAAYASTNASVDEFYTDDMVVAGDVFSESDSWWVTLSGIHTGEQDTERMYMGHRGDFEATYRFDKAGRCGLVETSFEIDLEFNRGYDDDQA